MRMNDYQALAAQAGYWSVYFRAGKKAKSLEKIQEEIYSQKSKLAKRHADTVDVEAFLEQERQFNEALKRGGGHSG